MLIVKNRAGSIFLNETVLLVESCEAIARCYQQYLCTEPYEVEVVSSGRDALSRLDTSTPDIILLDLHTESSALDILHFVKSKYIDSSVVVLTGEGGYDTCKHVMQIGAADYLEKPFNRDRLATTIRNVFNQREKEKKQDTFENGLGSFIGNSDTMQEIYRSIKGVSNTNASVFITGESGTGKEVCAQAIHDTSVRKEHNFVAINCAAIPRELIESELFGHTKGAFTGASSARDGAAHQAHKGTLFLDEIGEMPIDLQTKLLRFIQSGTFHKVGSSQTEQVDVRFICATNRRPMEQIKEGSFREDLYYRLNVIPLTLAPLRERGNDILQIAHFFLHKYSKVEEKNFIGFSRETDHILLDYPWHGNVRELQNVIRNTVILNNGTLVYPSMLPTQFIHPESTRKSLEPAPQRVFEQRVRPRTQESQTPTGSLFKTVDDIIPLSEVQSNAIDSAIALCNGNVTRAAQLLKVSPSTLYRKKQKK